jgi:glycosidase
MTRSFLLVLIYMVTLSGGCLKPVPATRLPRKTSIAVALVLDDPHHRQVRETPASLTTAVTKVLLSRNLVPRPLPFASFGHSFGRVRHSGRRLAAMAKMAGDTMPLLLLVETQPMFYSQLSGRYRWNVHVKLTLRDRKGASVVDRFEIPAFLLFDHQRQPEAVNEVAPLIASRLAELLDGFFGERQQPPASTPTSLPTSRLPPADSIYFILVDRFFNGDRDNDRDVDPDDPSAWHGGDLAGIQSRLGYLQGLGVRTLWLSPIFRCGSTPPGKHGAFHGYWTDDLARLDPRFGDVQQLRQLADQLHRRGMSLILDLVVNHVGYRAPLLEQRPHWFHRRGPITDWNDPLQLVEYDVHGLPDLAQEKEEVYAYLLGAARRWLQSGGIDGFRLDAVKHVPARFWSRFNRDLISQKKDLVLLGEHFAGDTGEVSRVQRAGRFSHMFDFALAYALRDVFCNNKHPGRIAAVLADDRLYADPRTLVTFLDNHDMSRIRTLCGGELRKVRQALIAQLALRGIPALTYGTEAGLQGHKEPENRSDMRFDGPLVEHVRKLLGLRARHPVLVRGATRVLSLSDDLLVLARVLPDEAALLLINGSDKTIQYTPPKELSGIKLRDALTEQPQGPSLALAPRATRLLLGRPGARTQMKIPTGQRRVEIRVTNPPKELHLAGSGPELGHWAVDRAVGPCRPDGDSCVLSVTLPVGLVFGYKLLARGAQLRWQPGPNRYLHVPEGKGVLRLEVSWDERRRG